MKVHGTLKKMYILKQCNFIEWQDTKKIKIKIKLSMTTSNYKLDKRYALVNTDIINNKKKIICTETITFFHFISDMNHITQNTDITSQLSTCSITPIIHNPVVAHIQIIIIHPRYFHIIITVDETGLLCATLTTVCRTSEPYLLIPVLNLPKHCLQLTSKGTSATTSQ